jgi:NAD(P) transhydrogenase subunit alpha
VSSETIALATIFILAIFVGFEVISKVPTTLHTPLMSGANAIHGIIIVGAMLVSAAIGGPLGLLLGFLAVVLGTANVVGGFVVTDRMLAMFKQRPTAAAAKGAAPAKKEQKA